MKHKSWPQTHAHTHIHLRMPVYVCMFTCIVFLASCFLFAYTLITPKVSVEHKITCVVLDYDEAPSSAWDRHDGRQHRAGWGWREHSPQHCSCQHPFANVSCGNAWHMIVISLWATERKLTHTRTSTASYIYAFAHVSCANAMHMFVIWQGAVARPHTSHTHHTHRSAAPISMLSPRYPEK